MCQKHLGLHGKKAVKVAKPVKLIKSDKPSEAELFFLMNEDILH